MKQMTDSKKEKRTDGVYREIFSMMFYLIFVVAATLLIIRFVGQRTEVSGHSMEDTLDDGDNLIVDKLTYRFRDPVRYDIIVFPYKYKEDTYYIKRIIGLPGEMVQITEEGNILINGEVMEESYGREIMKEPGYCGGSHHSRRREYFVLGDNRNASADSRVPVWGLFPARTLWVGRGCASGR